MVKRMLPVVGLVTMLVPSPTSACLNGVEMDLNRSNQLLSRAERLLEQGNAKAALSLLDDVRFFGSHVPASLDRRLTRIVSVAELRTGSHDRGLDRLLDLWQHRGNDPYLQARIAEGLARVAADRPPDSRGHKMLERKALAMLEDLASRDLMPDAEAFATLAALRANAGDKSGGEAALARCQQLSRRPGVCGKPADDKTATRS
jgi:hypothetical protein